ncbi:hypothetical protein P7C73_g4653, partial [Tremellales sp. Uapishka_1]
MNTTFNSVDPSNPGELFNPVDPSIPGNDFNSGYYPYISYNTNTNQTAGDSLNASGYSNTGGYPSAPAPGDMQPDDHNTGGSASNIGGPASHTDRAIFPRDLIEELSAKIREFHTEASRKSRRKNRKSTSSRIGPIVNMRAHFVDPEATVDCDGPDVDFDGSTVTIKASGGCQQSGCPATATIVEGLDAHEDDKKRYPRFLKFGQVCGSHNLNGYHPISLCTKEFHPGNYVYHDDNFGSEFTSKGEAVCTDHW